MYPPFQLPFAAIEGKYPSTGAKLVVNERIVEEDLASKFKGMLPMQI